MRQPRLEPLSACSPAVHARMHLQRDGALAADAFVTRPGGIAALVRRCGRPVETEPLNFVGPTSPVEEDRFLGTFFPRAPGEASFVGVSSIVYTVIRSFYNPYPERRI